MTARTLDGKLYRDEIIQDLTNRVSTLQEHGITPALGAVLIGDDAASAQYVGMKERDCAQVGVSSVRKDLPASVTQEEVLALIDELNKDDAVTGYIVQLPLPQHLDEKEILSRITPDKDVDGLTPVNLGRVVLNIPAPRPCTAHGIVKMLERFDVPTAGKEVVIVGRGITVGRPLSIILSERPSNATVTLCHTGTEDIAAHTRQADIIVAAAGVPHMITPDMVKPGATVIDVGVSGKSSGKTTGDVDPAVWEVAGAVSPNPGGVGPLTRAFLVSNVVEQAERQAGLRD